MDAIQAIADRHGLKVIYDAAHAFGVRRGDQGAGVFGDVSMFSFHATKVFHTIEGGLGVVKDPALVDRLQKIQNFGIAGPESVVHPGGNAKMNEFAAAMGLCNLRLIDGEMAKRAKVEEHYRRLLGGLPGIGLQQPIAGATANHSYFPVRIDPQLFGTDRDGVHDELSARGIRTRKYFHPLVSDFECYRDSFQTGDTPVAKKVASEVLTLPMYAELAFADVERVCGAMANIFQKANV